MLEKLRQKLLEFIYSDKDVPILAGFSVGFYLLLFYYSRNFSIANSISQLLFFTIFYIVIPVVVLFTGYKLLSFFKLPNYRRNLLFVGMIAFFCYYLLNMNLIYYRNKILLGIVIIACLLSFRFKVYYKLFIVLLFFISVFNMPGIINVMIISAQSQEQWKESPDNIEQAVFKKRPNIYYIQPDGYTSPANFKDSMYNFDNSNFETFLKENDFTVYEEMRSNYFSTLLSNSSMFSMKHHYVADDVEKYKAREIIVGDNAVLRTLKFNKYKTFFITERPYLIMNRPDLGYDFCNIPYKDLFFVKDGWSLERDVIKDLKEQMSLLKEDSGNFFFIEKFTPGHIENKDRVLENKKEAIKRGRIEYFDRIKKVNIWLKEVVSYIVKKDPNALIIIGADHGGYVGFSSATDAETKTQNKLLVNSIYGNLTAIKWNGKHSNEYDKDLKSAVNLYRVVFSYLSEEKKYLDNLQDNSSYISLTDPKGIYKYINDKGEVVFEKVDNVQN